MQEFEIDSKKGEALRELALLPVKISPLSTYESLDPKLTLGPAAFGVLL